MLDAFSRRLRYSRVNYLRLILLVAMLFTLLAALIFRTPGLLFMAALLWATHPMGTLVGRFMSRRLTATRAAPTTGMVGDIVSGRVRVFNTASTPAFLVHLRAGEVALPGGEPGGEHVPTPVESWPAAQQEPGAPQTVAAADTAADTATDRRREWPVVLLDEAERVVPVLQPQERIEWKPRWKLQRRGVHRLPPVQVGVRDPLGVFNRLEAKTEAHTITVLPQPIRLQRLGFLGGGQSTPSAPQQAVAVAEALDFHSIRAWQPGQPIRRVHWKSTARTGDLHIVEWEESFGSDLTVLLDARVATRDAAALDEALEAAITLTASVAAHLLENGYHFQMFYWQPPPRSTDEDVTNGNTADGSSSFGRGEPELLLHHGQARRVGDLKEILTALAKLKSLPTPRWSSAATLSRLARQAAPSLGHSGVLLIAPTTADIAAAVAVLSDVAGAQVHVLALDAASFTTKPGGVEKSGAGSNGQAVAAAQTSDNFYAHGAGTRVVRRSDSLAAALERE